MDTTEKIKLKTELKAMAVDILEERIHQSNAAMASAQDAANNEDKSTVGDKHEVSRSMAMFDREIHAKQLEAAKKELALVLHTDVTQLHSTIIAGTYVEAENGKYFFLSGLGTIETSFGKVYFLSLNSPLGKTFTNKKTGDVIEFNKTSIRILEVF